jgi:hypothetical protein
MIRQLMTLMFFIAASGCRGDASLPPFDQAHPLEQALVIRDGSMSTESRARLNLAAFVERYDTLGNLDAALRAIRISCVNAGSIMRCHYARLYDVAAKGPQTRWRIEFFADIDARDRRARVLRLCIVETQIDPAPLDDSANADIACDPISSKP